MNEKVTWRKENENERNRERARERERVSMRDIEREGGRNNERE